MFSEMFRAIFLVVCLLLTVFEECSASKKYQECYLRCKAEADLPDCEDSSGKRAVLCGNPITQCTEKCKNLVETVAEKNVEEDEQDEYIRKRELSELKKLIGIAF